APAESGCHVTSTSPRCGGPSYRARQCASERPNTYGSLLNRRRLAERGGFEPPVPVLTQYNRLAICPVQPLQHLSATTAGAVGIVPEPADGGAASPCQDPHVERQTPRVARADGCFRKGGAGP